MLDSDQVIDKAELVHGTQFEKYYQLERALEPEFEPSIVTTQGGLMVTDDMFKPKLIPPINQKKREDNNASDLKKDGEDEMDDADNNPEKQAFLK